MPVIKTTALSLSRLVNVASRMRGATSEQDTQDFVESNETSVITPQCDSGNMGHMVVFVVVVVVATSLCVQLSQSHSPALHGAHPHTPAHESQSGRVTG
jgi:hypothetical protein